MNWTGEQIEILRAAYADPSKPLGIDLLAMRLGRIKSNVTRERIRQIEAKATKRMRHPSRSKLLLEMYAGGDPLLPPRRATELSGPVEQLEEEPFEAPYNRSKEAPNPFPSVIDARGIVKRDELTNEPAAQTPAEPAEENTMNRCATPGCKKTVRKSKLGAVPAGCDPATCIDCRCKKLGIKRHAYMKLVAEQKGGKPAGPRKPPKVKSASRDPKPAKVLPARVSKQAALLDGDVTLAQIAEAVRLIDSIGYEHAKALAALVPS